MQILFKILEEIKHGINEFRECIADLFDDFLVFIMQFISYYYLRIKLMNFLR